MALKSSAILAVSSWWSAYIEDVHSIITRLIRINAIANFWQNFALESLSSRGEQNPYRKKNRLFIARILILYGQEIYSLIPTKNSTELNLLWHFEFNLYLTVVAYSPIGGLELPFLFHKLINRLFFDVYGDPKFILSNKFFFATTNDRTKNISSNMNNRNWDFLARSEKVATHMQKISIVNAAANNVIVVYNKCIQEQR